MKTFKLSIVTLLVALFVATPALARDDDASRAIETVLTNYETIPDRASLEAAVPDARQRLIDAANDPERSIWTRQRALTLLSLFPDAVTIDALKGLTADRESEIRRLAYYTLGRAFGKVADDQLVAFIARGLEDNASKVREFTVRGLRYVENPRAAELLASVAKGDDTIAAVARDALSRRER